MIIYSFVDLISTLQKNVCSLMFTWICSMAMKHYFTHIWLLHKTYSKETIAFNMLSMFAIPPYSLFMKRGKASKVVTSVSSWKTSQWKANDLFTLRSPSKAQWIELETYSIWKHLCLLLHSTFARIQANESNKMHLKVQQLWQQKYL